MLPHVGVGICTPRPRKFRAASMRMALASPSVPATAIYGSVEGRMCEIRIRRSDAPMAPGRDNVVHLAYRQYLAAHKPCDTGPTQDADDPHDVQHTAAQNRNQNDQSEQRWKGHYQFGEPHKDVVDPASEVARCHADHGPDQNPDYQGARCDDQRDTGSEQQPGPHVAPGGIGTEEMFDAWRPFDVVEVHAILIVERQPRRKDRPDGEYGQYADTEQRQPVFAKTQPQAAAGSPRKFVEFFG